MRKSSNYALKGAGYVYSGKYAAWRERARSGREAHAEATEHSIFVGLMMRYEQTGITRYTHGFPHPYTR